MPYTIPSVGVDANALFTALASDLDIDLSLPDLVVDTDFPLPPEAGNPAFETIPPVTLAQLTDGTVEGAGVFDVLMRSMAAHLTQEHDAQRITGADYAKAYLGGMHAVMQYGVQFLLGKDSVRWQNINAQAALKLSQAQYVRAVADIQLTRVNIQIAMYEKARIQLQAHVAKNEYATSKMNLVTSFEQLELTEAQSQLVIEQYDTQRAQTKDTLASGAAIAGILAWEKDLKEAQARMLGEQYELARAQIRDTLSTGEAVAGIAGIDKLIKQAQRTLTEEQTDTQRAQTKDTLLLGGPIVGIAAKEKLLKDAQQKLVLEQYESQRGQTRGTLSTGETVVGILGAQTKLYDQQVISYKRDAENKALKLMLDTWIARKTIDEGVAVPVQIDTAAIDTSLAVHRTNLDIS